MFRVISIRSLAVASMFGTVVVISILNLLAAQSRASAYDVNDAFIANETQMGGPTDPNGPYTYGYNFTPTVPSDISTSGLVHSGATGFNGTGAGVQGYYYPNGSLVPAILGNITNSTIATNFGATMQAGQLLLHPGGTSSGAFTPPYADAEIQYMVAAAGPYQISGSFEALSTGDAGIGVYVNGVPVVTGFAGAQNTITPFSFVEPLAAGSTVTFLVSPGAGGIGSNSTGLFANIAIVPEPGVASLFGLGAIGLLIAVGRGYKTCFGQRTVLSAVLVCACLFGTATLASAATINVDLEGYRGPEVAPTTFVGTGAAGGGTVFNGLSPTNYSDGSASTTTGDNQTFSSVGGLLDSNGVATPVKFSIGPVGVDNQAGAPGATSSSALFNDYVFNNSAGNGSTANFTISGLAPNSPYQLYLYAGFANAVNLGGATVTGGTFQSFTQPMGSIYTAGNTELFTGTTNAAGDITGTLGDNPNYAAGTNVLAGFSLDATAVPEPGSVVAIIGLCGMGLIGVAIRRRRHG